MDKLNITEMAATACPICDVKLNATNQIDNMPVMPKPGDYSMCMYCRTILRFNDNYKLKAITVDDLKDLPIEEMIACESTDFRKRLASEMSNL